MICSNCGHGVIMKHKRWFHSKKINIGGNVIVDSATQTCPVCSSCINPEVK